MVTKFKISSNISIVIVKSSKYLYQIALVSDTSSIDRFSFAGIIISTAVSKAIFRHSFESWNGCRVNQRINDASKLYAHSYNEAKQYLKSENK